MLSQKSGDGSMWRIVLRTVVNHDCFHAWTQELGSLTMPDRNSPVIRRRPTPIKDEHKEDDDICDNAVCRSNLYKLMLYCKGIFPESRILVRGIPLTIIAVMLRKIESAYVNL